MKKFEIFVRRKFVKMKNEKFVRITKMWDREWASLSGKNGADKLAWCRVPQNFQFVKGCNFCKEQQKEAPED